MSPDFFVNGYTFLLIRFDAFLFRSRVMSSKVVVSAYRGYFLFVSQLYSHQQYVGEDLKIIVTSKDVTVKIPDNFIELKSLNAKLEPSKK